MSALNEGLPPQPLVSLEFAVHRPLYDAAKQLMSGGDLSSWTHDSIALALSYFDALYENRRVVFETSPCEYEPLMHLGDLEQLYVPEIAFGDRDRTALEMTVDRDHYLVLRSLMGSMAISKEDFFNAAFALKICYDRCKEKKIGFYIEEDDPTFGRVLVPVEVGTVVSPSPSSSQLSSPLSSSILPDTYN